MKTIPALILSLFILVLGCGLNACQRSDSVQAARETDSTANRDGILTQADKDFVQYGSEMHVGEMEMARQAKQKSSNKDVTDYADSVISGHSAALKQLSDAVEQQGVQPSAAASLDTKYHVEFLSTLSGSEFDRQFIDLMIADHRDASDTFKAQLKMVQNSDLKDYIEDVASTLENRLQEAKNVQGKLTTRVRNR